MAKRPEASKDRWSEGPILPRWALWLMLPGMIAPVAVFVFIVVTQRAHDEGDCPYRELSRRDLGAQLSVIEETRNCIGEVEERRFMLARGERRRVLGERRFDRDAFAPARYTWQARVDDKGEVHVEVHNEGHGEVHFREGTAAELRRDGR